MQDVRGKFGSEGETVAFANEVYDGYDTIDWIVRQEWSNGIVGMFGDSYYGYTQWAAVASRHPALRAIVPRVTSASLSSRATRTNSDGKSRRVPTIWQAKYLSHVWSINEIVDAAPDFSVRPVSEVFDRTAEAIGSRSAWLDILRPHQIPVTVYPEGHPFDAKPLPVLHVVGWFDNIKEVALLDYLALKDRPGWGELQYLCVDSIDHFSYELKDAPIGASNDYSQSEEGVDRFIAKYTAPALEFFDVFLKEEKPSSSLPRVRWHLSHGPDELNVSESWPPAGTVQRRLAFDGAGLSLCESSTSADTVTWTHDPDDPVPATVSDTFYIIYEYPDESDIGARDDVVCFDSAPLADELRMIGEVSVDVHLGADAPMADLIVKLIDVDPTGRASLVAWGDAQVDLDDGPAEFRVDLSHVAYRFRPGHAVRVQLMASEFPTFLPNLGTGESGWSGVDARKVEYEILPQKCGLNFSVLS